MVRELTLYPTSNIEDLRNKPKELDRLEVGISENTDLEVQMKLIFDDSKHEISLFLDAGDIDALIVNLKLFRKSIKRNFLLNHT